MERFCLQCAHSYPHKETGSHGQKYYACRKVDPSLAETDAAYCAEMRTTGACGPEGKLWEPVNA